MVKSDDKSLMSMSESHLSSRRMSGSYGTGSIVGSETESQTTVQRQIFTTIGFVEVIGHRMLSVSFNLSKGVWASG